MKELIKRLNHIQLKVKAGKGTNNPSGNFNYRTCDQILKAVKPHMGTDCVILLTDEVISRNDKLFIKARAAITNGERSLSSDGFAEIATKIMSMSAPQLTGTSSTYARKLALSGLLMLDDNPDIDSRNQYAEEVEIFSELVQDNNAFGLYHFTSMMEPEVWQGVWGVYKGEHIPKGEIGVYRENLKQLKNQGREEALRAKEAFDSDDAGVAEEALAEYELDQQEFIRSLS